jgi:hypothetical protein
MDVGHGDRASEAPNVRIVTAEEVERSRITGTSDSRQTRTFG